MATGDEVIIRTSKNEEKGILLDSHNPEIVLIKLSSGYNIGIPKQDIVEIKTLKKAQEAKEKTKVKSEVNSKLPNIAMIITGGTISSKLDSKTGGVSWLTNPNEILDIAPEIKEICNIVKIEKPFMMASENMTSKEWQEIAKVAEKLLNDSNIQGIIITHGTDFLHYTAAALSFFLQNLNKPVVLTYSQRSTDRGSSDAKLNLICAARAAVSEIAEVMLVGHANLNDNFCYAMLGTKVKKLHSSRRDAFKPINTLPLAKIFPDKIEVLHKYNPRNKEKVKLDNSFQDKVVLIKFYPGQSSEILDYYQEKGIKGIVIEGSGLGHVHSGKDSWLPKIKKLIDSGIIVCMTTQTTFGRVDPYVYSPARQLLGAGVIYLEDMLSETALVKLGWVLAHRGIKVKELMLKNISKEFNPRLDKEFI
jgi:glutamyl-tRNA(Gln) amidotransferase subunit D